MLPAAPSHYDRFTQLDQAIITARLEPEQCDLQPVLTLLLDVIAPLPIAQQLDIAGYVFEQLAGVVKERASRMLAAWESWHGTQSPIIDLSGDTDLFVQSQALDVADLFAPALPTPYPSQRQPPTSRGSALADQAAAEREGGPGLETLDWREEVSDSLDAIDREPMPAADVLATLQSLSHGENIPQWSEQVSEAMQTLTQHHPQARSLPLLSLQQTLNMPLVEVWLALLLGDSGYQLSRSGGGELEDFNAWAESFYSGASLQVAVVE